MPKRDHLLLSTVVRLFSLGCVSLCLSVIVGTVPAVILGLLAGYALAVQIGRNQMPSW
jgi:hypothetical protein